MHLYFYFYLTVDCTMTNRTIPESYQSPILIWRRFSRRKHCTRLPTMKKSSGSVGRTLKSANRTPYAEERQPSKGARITGLGLESLMQCVGGGSKGESTITNQNHLIGRIT